MNALDDSHGYSAEEARDISALSIKEALTVGRA